MYHIVILEEDEVNLLQVSMHLLCGRNENHELPCGDTTASVSERELEVKERETGREKEIREDRDEGEVRSEGEKWSHAPPIRVKTAHTLTTKGMYMIIHCTYIMSTTMYDYLSHPWYCVSFVALDIDKQPSALQLLLVIPEGRDLSLPTPNTNKPSLSPNCYLVCRLFCADPHPKTTTVWATSNPHFNFKQVIQKYSLFCLQKMYACTLQGFLPSFKFVELFCVGVQVFSLFLTPSLLEQVCNNFTVVEVWHKTPGTNTNDEVHVLC